MAGGTLYGAAVWDPVLILAQILAVQCWFYASLGLLIALLVGECPELNCAAAHRPWLHTATATRKGRKQLPGYLSPAAGVPALQAPTCPK